jgi:hypothetical protein
MALLAYLSATAGVGRFAVVQNEVTSRKAGAAAVPAVLGSTIDLQETETTGRASAAKLTFGEGAVISLGQSTTFEVTRQEIDQATGASTSTLDLLVGKARIFVSRFWSGRPEVEVETPTAVVGIKGSEVVVEVAENGATTVTVISGHARVRAKSDPGAQKEMGPAEVLVVPKGGATGAVGNATATTLADLRAKTDPDPWAPRELPGKRPTKEPPPGIAGSGGGSGPGVPKTRFTKSTTATSSNSVLWNDPAASVTPNLRNPQGQ